MALEGTRLHESISRAFHGDPILPEVLRRLEVEREYTPGFTADTSNVSDAMRWAHSYYGEGYWRAIHTAHSRIINLKRATPREKQYAAIYE